MNYYVNKLEELNADGIDFVALSFSKEEQFKRIIASFTKEEFKEVQYVPKTPYYFWKLVNGKKKYIEQIN